MLTIFTLHSNFSQCHHLNVCCQDCTKLKTTCPWTLFTFTFPSLLLNERVGNGFHSVSWTDKNYRGSSTYNQSQSSCVLCQFVWIVWIWKKKDLEDRIWSNKFQKSWSLIRLCGSSGSDKMWKLVINKIPEFIDSLSVYMDQKKEDRNSIQQIPEFIAPLSIYISCLDLALGP